MPQSSRDTTEILDRIGTVQTDLTAKISEVRESVIRIEESCKPCQETIGTLRRQIYGTNNGGLKQQIGELAQSFDGHCRRAGKVISALIVLATGLIITVVSFLLGR